MTEMKTMNEKMHHPRYVKSVALFLAVLVLTLPFYSANAYASLRVTKNAGEDNVDGFVDAQGDKWALEVEAAIPGETITQDRLTMNGYPFKSCVQNPGGLYGCLYDVDFRNRAIPEATVPLDIKLFKQDGTLSDRNTSKSLIIDGSAPLIADLDVSQKGQDVNVSFTVRERPDNCVGLEKIEFFEDSTSLRALDGSALDAKIKQKCGENRISERMPLSASTATRTIKVVATDKLGHARTLSRSLFFDGDAPVINASSFKAGGFGRFVPSGVVDVKLSLQVKEERTTLFGRAKSTALNLDNEVACVKADAANNIFTCTWDVRADFSQGFTIEITVRDGGGRTDTETFQSTLTVDSTRPVVSYFGTARQHGGASYAGINTTIVAKFTETGSGMSKGHVAVNLRPLSASFGIRAYANECEEVNGAWECYWRGLDVVRAGKISLVEAADNVGNPAERLPNSDIELDILPPDIVENSLVVSPEDGEEGIYQSGDRLQIEFDVVEAHGLFTVDVDESGIVDDGGVGSMTCPLKPETDDTYHCTYITENIKSGYIPDAEFTIRAEDAAGNWEEVDKEIEIFDKDQETVPAFWSVKDVTCSPRGVDINTMKLINQRVFCTVELNTNAQSITLLSAQLAGCTGDTNRLKAKFMIGNFGGNTKPGIMLEFEVLDDDDISDILTTGEGMLDYECTLRLMTKRSNQVIQQFEDEKIRINVPLFETAFDRELRTIEDRIEDAKDRAENDLYKLIGTLNEILRWVQVICAMLPLLQAMFLVWDGVSTGLDSLRTNIFTGPIATAYCETKSTAQYSGKGMIDTLQELCTFASCSGAVGGLGGIVNSWSRYQQTVLDAYNKWTGGTSLGRAAKAKSLQDNLILSVAGLCIPGIVLNLEKFRQIECRYVGCLENDVKAGVATVESCRELKDYQQCKYVWGEVFQVIPFVGAVDQLLGVLKSMLSDPVGIANFFIVLGCKEAWCKSSGSLNSACNFFGVFVYLLDIIESMISGFEQIKTTTRADYCSQVL